MKNRISPCRPSWYLSGHSVPLMLMRQASPSPNQLSTSWKPPVVRQAPALMATYEDCTASTTESTAVLLNSACTCKCGRGRARWAHRRQRHRVLAGAATVRVSGAPHARCPVLRPSSSPGPPPPSRAQPGEGASPTFCDAVLVFHAYGQNVVDKREPCKAGRRAGHGSAPRQAGGDATLLRQHLPHGICNSAHAPPRQRSPWHRIRQNRRTAQERACAHMGRSPLASVSPKGLAPLVSEKRSRAPSLQWAAGAHRAG